MKINGTLLSNFKVEINDDSEQLLTAKKEIDYYLSLYHHCKFINATSTIYVGCFGYPFIKEKLNNITNDEGFVIVTNKNDVYISGLTNTGCLYGAYYFIEHFLGVDWLSTDAEIFTSLDDVDDIDITYNFNCIMRYCHNYNGLNPIFRTRQRCNFTVGDTNDKPSYGGIRGLKFAFSWGLFGHTFELFIPYEEYFISHPEYFSFHPSHPGENHRYQICLTNPDVLKIVTDKVLKYIEDNPGVKIISVSQNDAYADYENNYCVCPKCNEIFEKEGAYSGVILQFVNKVARAVKEKYPDILIHTFAYHFSEEPPKFATPDDNVIIQFCNHLPQGFYFTDNNPIALKEKRKLDRWFEISNNVFVWTYLCYHENYFCPIGNFDAIYYNTRYFFDKNVKGLFQQENSDFNCCNFSELRTYLVAKLFSNPKMSYEDYRGYINKFLNGYYGPSGNLLLEYIDLLDDKFRFVETNKMNYNQLISFYGDDEFIVKAKRIFEKVFALTKDEIYLDRLKKAFVQVRYLDLYNKFLNAKTDEDIKEYSTAREIFVRDVLSYGITMYREGGKIPNPDYIDYSKAPDEYSKKDLVINLIENKESDWVDSRDNTLDDKNFGFKFKLLLSSDTLKVTVGVKDNDIFTNDANVNDWAQDCVEIYLSEDFNRTSKNGPNDFMFRVNAHGLSYSKSPEKIIKSFAKKTKDGYQIELYISSNIINKDKVGFEILAHNFSNKTYLSTSYWNAFKFAAVYSSPNTYGIIKVRK